MMVLDGGGSGGDNSNVGSALSGGGGSASAGTSGGSGSGDGGSAGGSKDGGGAAAGGSGSALNGGTGQAANWRDSLPDDLKNDPTLSKFSDVQNLSKAYIEAQKAIGKKGIIKPSAGDTPEAWKAFREALGVPAADKYELGKIEGVEFPAESLAFAKKLGADIGVLPEDMTKILQNYGKFEVEQRAKVAAAETAAQTEKLNGLKKEWGEAFTDNVKKGMFVFNQAADIAGIDRAAALKWLDKESKNGNDTTFIKIMSGLSKLFGEDKMREGGVGEGQTSPAELDNQIKQVQGQLFAMKPSDGAYPGLKAKYEGLWRQKTKGL